MHAVINTLQCSNQNLVASKIPISICVPTTILMVILRKIYFSAFDLLALCNNSALNNLSVLIGIMWKIIDQE